jgi:DNA invertase Pin-like site-specific DNA recombinase
LTLTQASHTTEEDKLSVKQNMKMFNVSKTQVYEILKKKSEILKWQENCADQKIKRELQMKQLMK